MTDDQADYFSTNQWLNPQERELVEKMKKKEEEMKKERAARKQKITLDFAGRKIIATGSHLSLPLCDGVVVFVVVVFFFCSHQCSHCENRSGSTGLQ
jgi:hydrogenase maturation factor HypF (carbamoyltransferase family)